MSEFYYKYKSIDQDHLDRIEDIINGALYTPSLGQLNDPFEELFDIFDADVLNHFAKNYGAMGRGGVFKSLSTDKKIDEALLAALFSEDEVLKIIQTGQIDPFIKRVKVQCLSPRKSSIAMWTHYTKEFQGVLFEYSIENINKCLEQLKSDSKRVESIHGPKKVYYSDDRLFSIKSISENALLENIFTKFSDWSYEEEHRIVVILKDEDSKFFLSIPPSKIYYGHEIKPEHLDWLKNKSHGKSIPIEQMSKDQLKKLLQEEAANRSIMKLAEAKAKPR